MEDLFEYTVTLHNYEDLDGFYDDMETPGGNLFIPNRAVDISLRRPISRNTNYMLTHEEAILIKNDSRVMDIELTDSIIEGITPAYIIDDVNVDRWPNYTQNSKNWGLIAHRYKSDLNNLYGSAAANSDDFTKTINNKLVTDITINSSGKNVDVLIVDGHILAGHPEYAVNPDGTGGSRVIQINWKDYALEAIGTTAGVNDYDYGAYMPDGATLKYGASHGCHVAGTVAGNTHGWARNANIYNISPYSTDNDSNKIYYSNIYDFIRAWHRNKPINPVTGRKNPTVFNGSYSSSHFFINAWRIYEINYRGTAYTYPFIEPTSRRTGFVPTDKTTWQLNPDNSLIRSNPNAPELIAKNITGGDNLSYFSNSYQFSATDINTGTLNYYYFEPYVNAPAYRSASWADVQDMITEGIIVVGAAGNASCTTAKEGTADFNNYMRIGAARNTDGSIRQYSTILYPSEYYYNRGSAPGSVTGAICVGAMESRPRAFNWATSGYLTTYRTNKTNFSQRGSRIDLYAAGRFIMSPYAPPGAGLNSFPDARNSSYYNAAISGTSMASPQVAGMCACLAEIYPNMKPAEMIEYLKYHSQKNGLTDFSRETVLNDNFSDYGLNESDNQIAFLPETRPSQKDVFPSKTFKIRKTAGRVYPRPRIRRRG
jgi:hypothetical protein